MIAAFRRDHPQLTFLALAIVINMVAAMVPRRPAIEIAACLDMTFTVCALYYWLIVRPGLRPKSSLLVVALLGTLRAAFLFPALFPAILPLKFWGAVGLELTLVALVIAGVGPFRGARQLVGGEIAVFRYAFHWRARPDVPPGVTPFTLYKREGFNDLILMVGMASLLEVLPVHLLVSHWSAKVAWILTSLSLYGALWALALYRSFALRPSLIGNGEMLIRFGLLFSLRVPFDAISAIQSQSVPGALAVPRNASPSLYLKFHQPLRATRIFGLTRMVSAIGITPDNPEVLYEQLPYSCD